MKRTPLQKYEKALREIAEGGCMRGWTDAEVKKAIKSKDLLLSQLAQGVLIARLALR